MYDHNPILQKARLDEVSTTRRAPQKPHAPLVTPRIDPTLVRAVVILCAVALVYTGVALG